MTLNELFGKYLEDIDLTHQTTTIDAIKYRYNAHIKPIFGEEEIEKITFLKVKKYQKELVDGLYRSRKNQVFTPAYINIIIGLLKRLLKYANLMKYAQINIDELRGLELIKDIVDKYKLKDSQIVWSIKEFNQFIDVVEDKQYKVLFNILYYCGLRKGEVLSLRWNNVDLIESTLTINSTACKIRGKGQVVKKPKTNNSIRTIFINSSLRDLLLEYFLEVKKDLKNIDNLYVVGGIKMISFSTLDRRFSHYLNVSGVKRMNLHGFRHSHATMLLELTNDIYSVSKRLGHESIEVTEIYIHSGSNAEKEIIEKMECEIRNTSVKNSFDEFKKELEHKLIKEINSCDYSNDEIGKIISIYKFVKLTLN